MNELLIKVDGIEFKASGEASFVRAEKEDFYEKIEAGFFAKAMQAAEAQVSSKATQPNENGGMELQDYESQQGITSRSSRVDLTKTVVMWLVTHGGKPEFSRQDFHDAFKKSAYYDRDKHGTNISAIIKALRKGNMIAGAAGGKFKLGPALVDRR